MHHTKFVDVVVFYCDVVSTVGEHWFDGNKMRGRSGIGVGFLAVSILDGGFSELHLGEHGLPAGGFLFKNTTHRADGNLRYGLFRTWRKRNLPSFAMCTIVPGAFPRYGEGGTTVGYFGRSSTGKSRGDSQGCPPVIKIVHHTDRQRGNITGPASRWDPKGHTGSLQHSQLTIIYRIARGHLQLFLLLGSQGDFLPQEAICFYGHVHRRGHGATRVGGECFLRVAGALVFHCHRGVGKRRSGGTSHIFGHVDFAKNPVVLIGHGDGIDASFCGQFHALVGLLSTVVNGDTFVKSQGGVGKRIHFFHSAVAAHRDVVHSMRLPASKGYFSTHISLLVRVCVGKTFLGAGVPHPVLTSVE